MKLVDTILLPVDTDADYSNRLELLIFLSKKLKSKVVLLTVLPEKIEHEVLRKKLHNAVKSDLELIAKRLNDEGIETSEILVKYGKPSEVIAETAQKTDAGFVLTETRNTEKEGSYRLGTVTTRMLHESDKPVWVMQPGQASKVSNIICPTDFSKPSDTALENAAMLAKALKAKLRVLSVDESLSNRKSDSWDNKDQVKFDEFTEKTKKYVDKFDTAGLDITIETETGEAHEAILKSIRENEHDLLIMGTTGRTGLRRMLMGSVTEKVIREVPCSFITTKSEDIIQLRIDSDVSEFSDHFETANKLFEKGFYSEAIAQFNICLKINSMHVPSLFKLSKIYKILEQPKKAKHYDNLAMNVLNKVWDKQIEQEIRKHYS